jgi:hypothetical protein
MRRLTRLVSASILALGLVTAGCKTTTSSGARPGRTERQPRIPGLPKPLRLPAEPVAAIHVAEPSVTLATLEAYISRERSDARAVLERLGRSDAPGIEGELRAHVDLERPWDLALVEGQTIAHVPIAKDSLDAVEALLAGKPKVGSFGAVDLERPEGGPGARLAWLDRKAAALTLADTPEGLATGRELARAYGKEPLFFTIDGGHLRKLGLDVTVDRITAMGAGLHAMEVTADGVVIDRPELDMIADGALTGMLESPELAIALSTKYAQHDEVVKAIIARATREVNRQNFLIRGTLQDMLRRGASVLRSWNGRVLAGVGPSRHLLLAFGADDPDKAQTATLHLVRGVIDNLSLARSFGVSVPTVRFARNESSAAGTSVHVVTLAQARRFVPAGAAPLIDDRGSLRIAMGFPKRAGGAMMVVGPDAPGVLERWLGETARATPAADSAGDLLAATIAVAPPALAPVFEDQSGRAVLQLSAETSPTRVVVRRSGQRWTMTVEGEAARPRRPGHRAAVPTKTLPDGRAVPAPGRLPPGARPR